MTTIKTNYRKKYPNRIPEKEYQLWRKWHETSRRHHYWHKKRVEKQLRSHGYGYLVGDLPEKDIVGDENYQLILDYRRHLTSHQFDEAKVVRNLLRKAGLGIFAGDFPAILKPPLKERVLTPENIIQFTDVISEPVLGFLDTEFTTLKHEILSIGCVLYQQESGETFSFYRTAKPVYEKKLSPRCLEITHLTQEEIDQSEPFPAVMHAFKHFLKENKAKHLMTWGNSDISSLQQSYAFNRLSLQEKKWFEEKVVDIQPVISVTTDESRLQISLNDMKKYYHIEGDVQHHALSDAMDLKEIVLHFKNNYLTKEVVE
ncbi:MAG TPA: exonuclease domain-containing protein [Candidatus Fimiplasma intestinipullorum]|uniref:Exonuclease domain-containing protein n=1 Tax=Candidatus Fimiplasma intestinipullorum TaxID=2840825 RepID=A0A9D1HQQ7_9FIRM|nr:exonuclease domain-containing protein [Candidatus Fimiplasma intestinipullorum]